LPNLSPPRAVITRKNGAGRQGWPGGQPKFGGLEKTKIKGDPEALSFNVVAVVLCGGVRCLLVKGMHFLQSKNVCLLNLFLTSKISV
jgi:hypothetical protein